MDNWNILLVIIELVGFLAVLLPPVIKLAKSMTKLEEAISALSAQLTEIKTDNAAAHKRIWDKVDDHDETINDHETRITVLEHQKGE